jgi:hypothetical protein
MSTPPPRGLPSLLLQPRSAGHRKRSLTSLACYVPHTCRTRTAVPPFHFPRGVRVNILCPIRVRWKPTSHVSADPDDRKRLHHRRRQTGRGRVGLTDSAPRQPDRELSRRARARFDHPSCLTPLGPSSHALRARAPLIASSTPGPRPGTMPTSSPGWRAPRAQIAMARTHAFSIGEPDHASRLGRAPGRTPKPVHVSLRRSG